LSSSQEPITVRRFLLGIASEAEACRVEEAILTGELDGSFLVNSEDELIDEYCIGNLSAEERRAYIDNFLITAERKQRHAFGIALIDYARKQSFEETPPNRGLANSRRLILTPSWKQVAGFAAAASVLLAALASYEHAQLGRKELLAAESRSEVARLQATLAGGADRVSRQEDLSMASVRGEQTPTDRMPVINFSSSTRSISPVILRISTNVTFVRIEVSLASAPSAKYREVVLTQGGKQVLAQEFSAASVCSSGTCTSVVPASALPPGVYHFKFEEASSEGGFRELIDQVFRVGK
jgi:hypothetical protein